jgi:CubicO group peptidase (beta-lactamase class C family)
MSTAENMAHYAIAMDNAGMYRGRQLLSFEGVDRLFQSIQGYGMGWFVEQGHIFQGGANETFKTFVDLYPLRDMSVVLLINQGYMFDHYISSPQIFKGVEAIVLGSLPPPVSQGWSVRQIGWGLLVFVVALSLFQIHNLLALRGWRERRQHWSVVRVACDFAFELSHPHTDPGRRLQPDQGFFRVSL